VRALLDVNVLIALLDSSHIHHATARDWLGAHIPQGWASCAITQNGCIRILAQPGYPNAVAPAEVATRLREATESPFHQYWSAGPSLLEASLIQWEYIVGSRQVTDAYLLALAVHQHARLVTFDHSIARRAVPSASAEHLVVL
jgi:hypothetical protein